MTIARQSHFWTRPRAAALIIAFVVIAVFLAANAHLVAVAFSSQPDCVLPSNGEGVAYRAAKPSC